MNLTVTLETAKMMKQSGRDKECYFVWEKGVEGKESLIYRSIARGAGYEYQDSNLLLAPTAQEILDELPKTLELNYLDIQIDDSGVYAIYMMDQSVHGEIESYETLAEALAHLRIRCKENGHIK